MITVGYRKPLSLENVEKLTATLTQLELAINETGLGEYIRVITIRPDHKKEPLNEVSPTQDKAQ